MDVVFYDYDEKPWRRAWRKYFKEGCGSFSDISLMEDMGVCAANIGIGYYHQHTINCYAYIADTRKQLEKFSRFYQENKDIKYPHSNWWERNHRKKQAKWNVRYKQDISDYTAKHYGDDYAAYRNQYQYLDNDGFWRDKEGFFDAWEEYRAEECV
jgi:hypothetical protein